MIKGRIGVDSFGKPYIHTAKNRIKYIMLEGNEVKEIETKELIGINPYHGNYYKEDYKKEFGYYFEVEKNKAKIVKKDKNGNIINEIIVNDVDDIKRLKLMHICKLGNIHITVKGYNRIYSQDGILLSNGEGMPVLFDLFYETIDRNGNIYTLDAQRYPLKLIKWERK